MVTLERRSFTGSGTTHPEKGALFRQSWESQRILTESTSPSPPPPTPLPPIPQLRSQIQMTFFDCFLFLFSAPQVGRWAGLGRPSRHHPQFIIQIERNLFGESTTETPATSALRKRERILAPEPSQINNEIINPRKRPSPRLLSCPSSNNNNNNKLLIERRP